MYLGGLALVMMGRGRDPRLRRAGVVLLLVLLMQVALGIANVLLSLPLPVAVAHTGMAAVLLMTLVFNYHVTRPAPIAI